MSIIRMKWPMVWHNDPPISRGLINAIGNFRDWNSEGQGWSMSRQSNALFW